MAGTKGSIGVFAFCATQMQHFQLMHTNSLSLSYRRRQREEDMTHEHAFLCKHYNTINWHWAKVTGSGQGSIRDRKLCMKHEY